MTWRDDEPGEAEGGSRPPLPPEDRLWRHPSEMGRGNEQPAAPPRAASPPASSPRSATNPKPALIALAFLAGIGVTLATLAALGELNDADGPNVVEQVAGAARADDPEVAAAPAIEAMVAIDVTYDGGHRTGSGMLFRDDGHIVTSADLLTDATSIRARLSDGSSREATLSGSDPATDLAVVKIPGSQFPTVVLGSTTSLETGERIIALGSSTSPAAAPLVAEGVVQALGVRLDTSEGALFDLVLATQPAGHLPPGSAFLDQRGAVVAVVTSRPGRPVPDPGVAGAYGIPMQYAREVARDLADTGEVRHPWLGIDAVDAGGGGAEIRAIRTDSPAAAAGLESGDIITTVDGKPVTSYAALMVSLRSHEPGDTVVLGYRRSGEDRTSETELAEVPETT